MFCPPQAECQVNALRRCAKLGFLPLCVEDVQLHAFGDTGATLTKFRVQHPDLVPDANILAGLKLLVADGAEVPVLQSVEIRVRFSGPRSLRNSWPSRRPKTRFLFGRFLLLVTGSLTVGAGYLKCRGRRPSRRV